MFTSRPRRNRVEQVVTLLVATCLSLLAISAGAAASTNQPTTTIRNTARHNATTASLDAAATSARQADHRLVADAKTLKTCLSAHPTHCKNARRTLQRAGTRLAVAQRTLAKIARATDRVNGRGSIASRRPSQFARQAPQVTVSGQTLTWTRIANVNSYVFVRKVPGQAEQYSVVSGTSITPPAVPGTTVHYSVRTNVEGSAWAHEVTITYPAITQTPPIVNAPDPQAAPAITASGQTLTWNEVANVSTYVLVTKVPGQAEQYSVVSGTSITPPAVPGATVHYSVRTDVEGSAWALEVPIIYPAQPVSGGSSPSESPPSSTKAPALPESPISPKVPVSAPEAPASSPESPASSSETFGLPFVKGINASLQGWGINNMPSIVSEMNSLGVNWEREDLAWSEIEPEKGVFKWTGFDKTVTAAKADGITLLPIVGYAPSWTSPSNAAAYAEFVAAAVARYGPGTSANLQWWELWNEPYFAYAWSEHNPEPEAYGRDALAAAEAAKKVAPSVKLLLAADYQESAQTGGSSPEEKTWIDDMFTAAPTLGKWIDGVSVHPYGGDPALPLKQKGGYLDTSGMWGFQRIDTIREKFLAHGVNVPFWITEEGWSTWEMSEATQAHYYADLIQQIKLRPWIRALFPFGLREGTAHPTNNQPGFALLKYGTWEPKEAWTVLQAGFKELS